ncbi:MAG: IS66 family insertion sequence element accessory protein TnpB [Nocardioidaceae bacterium]
MLHLSTSCKYYLYNGKADMRKGFDSLSGIVTSDMQGDLLSGAVFIFLNKKRNQVKLLLWEGDGLALYHKRLEKGTYELPSSTNASSCITISAQQLQFILQGVSLQKIHFRPRYKKTA